MINLVQLVAFDYDVRQGTAPGKEEGTYIKEKLARLYVEVAKRQWPLSWPQMDEQLMQLYRSGV